MLTAHRLIPTRLIISTVALAVCATATLVAGCRSDDRHLYQSHTSYPTTLTVVKTPSQEPVWSYDIPAGYHMILDFDSDHQAQRNYPGGPVPTEMNWALYSPTTKHFYLAADEGPVATDVVAMPGTTVAIKVTYREPETQIQRTVDLPAGDVQVSDQGVVPVEPQDAQQATQEPGNGNVAY